MIMDAVLVPEWTWVEPIGSDGYRLGVTCATSQGGAVEEIGRSGRALRRDQEASGRGRRVGEREILERHIQKK